MHKLLNKQVSWLGKCALCKKEQSLCKCGLIKDMDGGMGTTTTNLMMKEPTSTVKTKSTKVFTSAPPTLGHVAAQTIGLTKKTKKSENFIDLKNENIEGKRIKNVGGAGYTPGEKKLLVVESKGSGGLLTKSIRSLGKGGPGSGKHKEGVMTDYSHLLPESHQKAGLKLQAMNVGKHFHSTLSNDHDLVGTHASSHSNLSNILTPEHTYAHPQYNEQGKHSVKNLLVSAVKAHHASAMAAKVPK